ncbi:DUF58 domain-containing protein [Microbacterium luticocti]|uniref:DUF58 domain-containing protein n=1 Tax=Microbacterium luticocti TaxID=451764 RepID=UPI00041E2AB5|nr:DUF58 domain-containing protein [Microbacterium luticocti]
MSRTEPPLTRRRARGGDRRTDGRHRSAGLSDTVSSTLTAPDGSTTVRTRVADRRRGWLVASVIAVLAAARRARSAGEVAARWLGETVNPAGWLVLALGTVGVALGWAFGWVEVLVAGFASLVLLAMSAPFLFGARGYDVSVHLAHERVVAGDPLHGEIVIRNVGTRTALPGRIDLPVGDGLVELGVPLLRPGHQAARPVSIPPLPRGVVTVGPPTAVRTDPVGLLRREHEWDERHEIYVHPRTAAVPATSAGLIRDLEGRSSRRLVDADMSFHAIREYVPGDARRQIHWKSTAKTGRLMVRQFEETRRSRLAVVLSLAESEYAGTDEFELAVSVAASLGVQAVRDGRDIDVVTGAEIPRVVRGRMRSIEVLQAGTPRGLLDGFSRLDAHESTMPLAEVCRLAVEASDMLSLAFLVCGSQTTPLQLRQAALAFSAATAVVAVVCDQAAPPRTRPLGELTVMTVGVLDDLPALLLRGAQSSAGAEAVS